MKKGTLWLIVSGLMVVSLLFAACGPAPAAPAPSPAPPSAPSSPTPAPAAPAAEKPQQEAAKPSSDVPKYGGTLTYVLTGDILNFDPAKSASAAATFPVTNDMLFSQSWARGPAGTGEDDFSDAMVDPNLLEGDVAESWSMPTAGTFVFKIRQGVHYGLNPNSEASRLVNGRVLTADDIVYAIQRDINEPLSPPKIAIPESVKVATVTKTGPWEVTLKVPVDTWRAGFYWLWGAARLYVPDVVQKYGDMTNWRNSVGVGPFMLVDNIPGSSATLVKNPNYYMKDTAGPGMGNQLPYVDSMKLLVVPDLSTRVAAIRTGRIDLAHSVNADDARSLLQTTPTLKSGRQRVPFPMGISLRMDRQDLPYKDIKVRQALTMATNFDDIVTNYYKGDAVKIAWPVSPGKLTEGMFWPFDTLPQNLKDLYTYNPTKAKQLLTEAGYPNGFKSTIIVPPTGIANYVDLMSIVKDEWSKIGVTLEIQLKDQGTYNSIGANRSYDDMYLRSLPVDLNNTVYMSTLLGEGLFNISFVRDQKVAAVNAEMQKYVFIDQAKVRQLFHDLVPYALEQAWVVPVPLAFQFAIRQPWVKGYYTQGVGALGTWMNWPPHAWIDQDLKKSMGF